MTTEHDPRTRIVLSWLRDDAHENAERVLLRALDEVDATPQRRPLWPAWRGLRMHKLALTAAAGATALAVAVVGTTLIATLGIVDPAAVPSPSPTVLARGTFLADYLVDIEAYVQGSRVTGQMTVSERSGSNPFTVDLECAEEAGDGSILIGGVTTKGNLLSLQGNFAALAIHPGTPMRAGIWIQQAGAPVVIDSCFTYLSFESWRVRLGLAAMDRSIELGTPPSGEPSIVGGRSLPVGPHALGVRLHGDDLVRVNIPAPGWFATDRISLTKSRGGDDDQLTVVVLPGDHYTVPRNTCDWQLAGEPDSVPRARFPATTDEFVAFVSEQAYDVADGSLRRDFSAPANVTIDGFIGQRIVDQAPAYPDSDASACDEQRYCTVQDRDKFQCLLSHVEPGALDTLWIVQAPEVRNYYLVVAANGTPSAELRAEMDALVESMTFVE